MGAVLTFLSTLFVFSVVNGTPLLYGTLGEILTEKSGNMNLGVEGILFMGGAAGLGGAFYYEKLAGANASPFVALLLVSLGYTLGEASLLAVMFLPGLFAFRHFLPQIRFAERRRGALQLFYLTGAVLAFEYVALMLTNFYLRYNASVWRYDITMPDLLQNPLFILLLLAACALPMHWIELRCNTQPARDRYVEFISDRRRVRLETERISYLESNDSEVWIHTSTGESLRTKTKISQWEQQLDDRFLRIHRSYIVNADRVARHTAGAVVVDGRTLEVSRKYRDSVRAAIPESAPSARVRHISNDKPS